MFARVRGAALGVGLAVLATCCAVPAAASAACTAAVAGGEWPMYGHDVANTRAQPAKSGLGPSAVAGMKPAWTFSTSSTGDGTAVNTTPVVYGGWGVPRPPPPRRPRPGPAAAPGAPEREANGAPPR